MTKQTLVVGVACALAGALGASLSSQSLGRNAVAQTEGVAPVVDRFRPRPSRDDAKELLPIEPTQGRQQKSPIDLKPPKARVAARTTTAARESIAPTPPYADEWTPEERVNISVYEKTNRSVVNIMTKTVRPDFFFYAEVAEGSGSGSVLDTNGHILTNLHVIEGAREIRVTLFNGETYEAGLVGQDPLNDIAVLRIAAPKEDLHPLKFGEYSRLRVGQKIFALGNPFGLERTLTTGIVSSLNRTLPSRHERRMKSIIQIDAALNRGNSGGPLLNSRGELIGVNTAIASRTGENTGVGFAIPVSTLQRVIPQLITNGKVVRSDTGIEAIQTDQGLVIARLATGGPGEQAGLQGFRVVREQRQRGPYLYERTRIDQSKADIIVRVEGKAVDTRDALLTEIERKRPGDKIILTILREGEELDVEMTLGAK